MSTASPLPPPSPATGLCRRSWAACLSGTFWLALRVPLQVVFSLWTTRLILEAIGPDENGAYGFAWGFGFFQFLFEFGASSALQRQISDAWTRGDRDGRRPGDRLRDELLRGDGLLQVAALLGVAYWALPHSTLQVESYPLVVKLLWLQAMTAPCFGFSVVVSSVLQAARRYDFVPRFELVITVLRFAGAGGRAEGRGSTSSGSSWRRRSCRSVWGSARPCG